MASRYWVGGSANWNTTGWSTTDGGSSGSAAPTAADDVFFTANSTGTCTIPTGTTVLGRSINCTGHTGTIAFASTTAVLTLGNATAGASNIAAKFVSGQTITLTGVGTINFVSTSATLQTIDSGGKTLPNLTFNSSSNGNYQLAANLTISSSGTTGLVVTQGTFDDGGFTVTTPMFASSNSNVRTVKIGATWTMTSQTPTSGTYTWDTTTTTNLTFTGLSTSTLTFNNTTATAPILFLGGGLTYGTVQHTSVGAVCFIVMGSNTFSTFNFSNGTTTATGRTLVFGAGTTNTFTTFTCVGTAVGPIAVISSKAGTAATLSSSSSQTCNFLTLRDITVSGGGTWTAGADSTDGLSSGGTTSNSGWSSFTGKAPDSRITATLRDSGYTISTTSSYTTNSVTPSANTQLVLVVAFVKQADPTVVAPTSVTGNSLTWTQYHTQTDLASRRMLVYYYSAGASPTTGALTIDFNSVSQNACGWALIEFNNCNTSVMDGAIAMVQNNGNTSITNPLGSLATLSAFKYGGNATVGAWHGNNSVSAAGSANNTNLAHILYESHGQGALSAPYEFIVAWEPHNVTKNWFVWPDGSNTSNWSYTSIELGAATKAPMLGVM